MGCNCKKKDAIVRANNVLYGRTWEELDDVEKGQIGGIYYQHFKKYATDEEIINWLNLKQ